MYELMELLDAAMKFLTLEEACWQHAPSSKTMKQIINARVTVRGLKAAVESDNGFNRTVAVLARRGPLKNLVCVLSDVPQPMIKQ